MRSMLENLLAERRSRRSDRARVLADAVDRPARIAAVGGRHVFGDRRMFAIAADAQMRGDPLAFEENLDRPGGHPDVHLGAGEAIGNAVIVRAGVDVIIDADPTDAPFAEDIGLGRQRLERRTVDLLQQLPASHAEPPDGSFFVQMLEQLADGFVDLSQADEDAVTQPPEQPALDNQHRLFDFRLVARFSRARRQDGGVVMGRHFGIGAIDQRVIEAGLYDGGPGIVRHEQMRNAAAASNPSSLRPSGSGQIKSELSKRLKVSRTVERANPRRRAISLVVSEDKYLRRMITRTSRMATLSAGIGAPLVAQRSDLKSGQRRDAHPGGIIPLQVAQSSRYEWRHHLVTGGGFRRNQQTDAVLETVAEWQNRPLEPIYPLVFFDALRVKIRDEGLVRNKAVYVALGVTPEGTKDILGLWIETSEGAKFWLRVMTELKNRGVEDILIAVVDGLKGFPEAIAAVFPPTIVQTCIVHLIGNSMDFASWKDRKPIAAELKAIYRATDADVARRALEDFNAGVWGRKYPAIAQSWRRNWEHVIPFFAFPVAVRRIIYTTNAIESLNAKLRRAVRTRGHFPTDEAAIKLLYLVLRQVAQTWKMPPREWCAAKTQFAIMFDDRFVKA